MIKFISILLLLQSCSLFMSKRDRVLQTEIVSKLSEKAPELAACAKKSNIFGILKEDRIRVVMKVTINSEKQIERFSLDNPDYPEDFSNCAFQIVDLISFPQIKSHELLEVEQPFIFSKKR